MSNPAAPAGPPVSSQEKRALLAERLRRASKNKSQSQLSFAQERLWFLDQLEPNSPLYNVPLVARLTGHLNIPALEQSLAAIVARHDVLRTRFECPGENPAQTVYNQVDFKLRLIPMADPSAAEEWIREEVRRPFNLLGAESLLRAALIELGAKEHLLVLNMHHIVADEWSLKILLRELQEFYVAQVEGNAPRLQELPIQYADYAAWQRRWLDGDLLKPQFQYWTERLSGNPPVTELQTDRTRGGSPTFAGRTLSRRLDPALRPRLQQLAGDGNATLFMVMLAAFQALVHRYTGLDDVIVGTPIAGRNRLETERLIGFFVNTLLLRTSLAGNPSFAELLQRARDAALGAYAHQDLPFEKLVQALRPERSSSHLAFTRIMFALQGWTETAATLPGLTLEWLETDTGTAKFDLTFVVKDWGHSLTACVEYNCDLFHAATMERLLEHFENLLQGIARDPAQRLSELPLLGESERRRLLVDWNNNATDYPRHQCIHQLFEARVPERPEAEAVIFGNESLTYFQLNERANQLAHWLRRRNLKPGDPVAICMERSARMIVGILGILKAGGAYVPLDPRYPKERLSFMLADTQTPLLITQESLLRHLPHRGLETICLDADHRSIAGERSENLPNRATPDNTAYIIYTSGSTGRPKGVAVPHRAVNRLVLKTNYIALDATDRIAQVSNISFDAATFEIWGALLNGGQLRGISADVALSPKDFARELREQGITAMFLTSALFSQLAAEAPGAFATMRTLLAGGEALDPKWVRAVLRDRPPLRLVNGYGPTENTTFTCCALLRDVPEDAGSVPIGRPIANTQVYILDSYRNPVPAGVPGELYTGGDGLAIGYWRREELSREKFVSHQFSPDGACQCLYRTGDLARYLPDGNIEFLGRLDNQVKIRGFRVELGEIEAVIGRFPGVRECAVKASGTGAGQTRLTAFFVAEGKRGLRSSQLRGFLADQLPEFMVPAAFVQIPALPLTPNGKVDRAALPEPERGRPMLAKKYASPRDAIELELSKIWESVLGIEPIGIEDQFFDLGGHSFLAMRMVARIEKAFGKKLRLATIFMAPTIEKLAAILRDEIREGSVTAGTSLVELQAKGTRPPLFFVHGAGGGMFWGYVNLARRLGLDQPVFGLSSRGLDGRPEFATIEEMAAQYVRDLRAVQPRGPYHLGGYCFGGNVAYEMARQLEAQDEKVALLALLNCAPPNSHYMRIRWTPRWCAAFIRNLFYWTGYCRQWTRSQRRDFLRWKCARLKHWVTSRLSGFPTRAKPVEADGLMDLSSLPEQQRELWRTHIDALMKFRPRPYSGLVHLFRSPGHPLWCSFADDYGWGEFARQKVAITVVRGAHEKILEEPWVDETAAELVKVLEKTRENDLEFWKRELAGAPSLLELPTEHTRPAARTKLTGEEIRPLPKTPETMDPAVLVLAALNVVLHRYSGQEDLLVGEQIGTEDSANVVVLRTSLTGNPTGRDLINRVREGRIAALHHRQLPFKELLTQLCPATDPASHPLVQIFFSAGNRPAPEGYDLRVCLVEGAGGPALRLNYAADLFNRAGMQRMLGHLETALQRIATSPERPLSELSILTPTESDLLLKEWNRTEKTYPNEKTLFQLFAEQAARTPDAEALICGTRRLTYRQLLARATIVAHRLRALGVGKEDLVGICLERSEDLVAGILGMLQAGAAYVPLDPAYPKARLEFIVKDAGMRAVLTRQNLREMLPASQTPVLCVEDLSSSAGPFPAPAAITPDNLAYVLYTSGSTGQPKGVALEHRGAVALVCWAREAFSAEEIAGVLASTSICFDLSVFELFVPLSWGGKIILAENALALPGLPAASEVTLVNTVPSAIRELLRVNGVPASVRVVNLAGEPLGAPLVEQIYADTSVRKVYDLYGPTETTTYSTFALRQPGEPATIGRPLPNEKVYILDNQMQPAPAGIPGDLYIGGAGLARGYLNRPDLTAERFLADPFQPGARLYKTGDVARWREDGNLVYLGRSDHQVKIRGFRIELGEIELALKNHPAVADAVVIAREDRPGEKRLAAYVALHQDKKATTEELRRAARDKLPEYMVPTCFVFLPQLPLTPNGKVDRKALPTPPEEPREASAGYIPPRTDMERQVASIWAEVLGRKTVGATDNFFELGGHSLLAMQVLARLRASLKAELSLSLLFEMPSVETLAAALESDRGKAAENLAPPLAPISRDKDLPASFMQEQLWFLNQLDPASDAYNVPMAVRLKGLLDLKTLQLSLDTILRRHEALRTTLSFSDGSLKQTVDSHLTVKVNVLEESPARLLDLLQAEARRPFDLKRGPLLRASVVRMDKADHALLIVMHHAVIDGWSLDILFRELEAAYKTHSENGSPPQFAVLPIQYADFSTWQRSWMANGVLEKELTYWREKLSGAPAAVNFPREEPRAHFAGNKAARQMIELPGQLRGELAHLGQSQGATLFMVLLAGLAVALQKWTGQSDMVLGTVVAGRTRKEIEGLIGCFMNFLPLRIKTTGAGTAADVLRAVKVEVIEAQSHQDCPFGRIVESLKIDRHSGRNPLYNVALLFQNSPDVPRLASLQCSPIDVPMEDALLDLRFEANETGQGLALLCEYKADLFGPSLIENLLASFRAVLETMARSPETALSAMTISSALSKKGAPAEEEIQAQTLAISSTFTAEPVEEPLRYWLNELEVSGKIKFAPYNQVFQQLLDPASVLAANQQGLNILLIRLNDWQPAARAPNSGGPSSFGQAIKRHAEEFARALQAAAGRSGVPILVCFCPPPRALANDPSKSETLAEVEQTLAGALTNLGGVHVATTRELAALYPVADYDDPAAEELGHIPYTPLFFTALAALIARKFHALRRPAAKVIALDCDQTLWSGVCGEDGPGGIRLDPPRLALQQFMRRQQESGKLLVICSKNEEADVSAVFEQGQPMPLRKEHFTARRVNWRSKSENLKSLAQELKLGLDSFILVDDNPVECAEVEANCSEVLTLQLPEDPALIPQFLDHCWAFDQLKTTEEDRGRPEMYRQNQRREKFQAETMSFSDFIGGLQLEVQIAPATPALLPRLSQLTQRTNQFNTTGRRRAESDLRQWAPPGEILAVSVKDRFGDYGLVGAIMFEARETILTVDSFLLSCRALGRGVEHQMLSRLGQIALERGAQWVDVSFERLPRNQPALDFLESAGDPFKQTGERTSLFHFPAKFAAEVIFKAQSAAPAPKKEPGADLDQPAVKPRKFSRYRGIALESCDLAKLHRRIEAQAVPRPAANAEYVPPHNETERKLCALWQKLLNVERVGREDDFFELGGHSLLAVRLFAEVEKMTGRKLPLVTLFQAPTAGQLAAMIEQAEPPGLQSLLVPIQPAGGKSPLYLVHGAGGDVLWGYANLVAHMDADQPIYALKSRGQSGLDEFERLEEMAACYLQVVRARQPEGPYYLGGYCFGGNVAYEMARQLQAAGEKVGLLALLDSAPANAGYETVQWWRPGFLYHFSRNLYYWLRDFQTVEPRDRRRFMARKLRTLGRKLARRLRGNSNDTDIDLEEVIDPSHFPESELKLWKIHLCALEEHVQGPYAGPVTLFRTRGHPLLCSFAPDLRWGALARDGVTVKLIPGSHENIFMEPNVKRLAESLTAALAETRPRVENNMESALLTS
jgi:amino acid adenylation domain-containing protein/FkbH-like protein